MADIAALQAAYEEAREAAGPRLWHETQPDG
jgi:hypothetical protein